MVAQQEDVIRVHRFLPVTEAEGPGRRACLWVQGCGHACKGCFNREAWGFSGGHWRSVHSLFAEITRTSDLEGLTLSGGEPFLQARALARLAQKCRARGLSVMTYTGFEYDFLRAAKQPDWDALLAATDLLLAGPFIQAQKEAGRPWVGSRNKTFHFLSRRYRHLAGKLSEIPQRFEILVEPGGNIALNGVVSVAGLQDLQGHFAAVGLQVQVAKEVEYE